MLLHGTTIRQFLQNALVNKHSSTNQAFYSNMDVWWTNNVEFDCDSVEFCRKEDKIDFLLVSGRTLAVNRTEKKIDANEFYFYGVTLFTCLKIVCWSISILCVLSSHAMTTNWYFLPLRQEQNRQPTFSWQKYNHFSHLQCSHWWCRDDVEVAMECVL